MDELPQNGIYKKLIKHGDFTGNWIAKYSFLKCTVQKTLTTLQRCSQRNKIIVFNNIRVGTFHQYFTPVLACYMCM